MAAGILVLLLLMHSCSTGYRDDADEHAFIGIEYSNFGGLKGWKFNAIERLVLDALFRCNSMSCSPELPLTVLNGRAPLVSPRDKTRCVMLTLLTRSDWYELLEEKLIKEYSFGSHKLLRRLFDDRFISWHGKAPLIFSRDRERRSALATAIKNNPARLDQIQRFLQAKMSDGSLLNLKQFTEKGGATASSLDILLYLHHMRTWSTLAPKDLFSMLVGLWSDDPAHRNALMPVICDTIRTALQQRVFDVEDRNALKLCVVSSALANFQQEYFELFEEWYGIIHMGTTVLAYIRAHRYGEISERSMACYIDRVYKTHKRPLLALGTLFDTYFRQTYGFRTMPMLWNSAPDYFNRISYIWLCKMFAELCYGPFLPAYRDALMAKYMGMMNFAVFTNILKYQIRQKDRELSLSMLRHLDARGKGVYRRHLRNATYAELKLLNFGPACCYILPALGFTNRQAKTITKRSIRRKDRKSTGL
ncbi:hypothetical protein PAPHI01_2354 [Pancytospora philotis]|nr:hypothetical protein PAPHI01_2354 [Pancytospora philotis]